MATFKKRVEFLGNGITIANMLPGTGEKESHYNSAKVSKDAADFVSESISNAEPGEYYDIHITVSKQRNKKPA